MEDFEMPWVMRTFVKGSSTMLAEREFAEEDEARAAAATLVLYGGFAGDPSEDQYYIYVPVDRIDEVDVFWMEDDYDAPETLEASVDSTTS